MNEVLPIGSIIYLKEGQQKVMILSRGCQLQQDNEVVFFWIFRSCISSWIKSRTDFLL